jgi:hypothetical protein
MATILKAGNVATGAQITSDATGILEIRTGTGAGTTAITVGTDQAVTFAAGTTVSSLTTSGAVSAGSLTVNSNNISAVNSLGFRNRIINGGMVIDQRNNGASVTGNNQIFPVDRWVIGASQTSKLTAQRNLNSVTPPTGFSNYMGFSSSSAYSLTSTDEFEIIQYIEGFNTADLGWGNANAQTITLSFWVRSSLTGTFGGSLSNHDGNRGYAFSFVINAANTWEYKTITIAGDTTGTWQTGNLKGITVMFSLGAGSSLLAAAGSWGASFPRGATGQTNLVSTNGATFYITGVQLEAGSVATPFERRDYGRELMMCQRYYEASGGLQTLAIAANSRMPAYFAVAKRAAPTVTYAFVGGSNSVSLDQTTTSGFRINNSGSGSVSSPCDFTWTAAIEL